MTKKELLKHIKRWYRECPHKVTEEEIEVFQAIERLFINSPEVDEQFMKRWIQILDFVKEDAVAKKAFPYGHSRNFIIQLLAEAGVRVRRKEKKDD